MLASIVIAAALSGAGSPALDCNRAAEYARVMWDARRNGATEDDARAALIAGGTGQYGFVASTTFRTDPGVSRFLVATTVFQQCEDMQRAAAKR